MAATPTTAAAANAFTAGGLRATLATGGIAMALDAAPKLLEGLFANDKANRQRASQRKSARMAHRFKAEQLKASYQNQYNKTDAYNRGLVAQHNSRVERYDANIALLQKEEAFAYEAAQLNAGAEVASFMEDNLDLMKGFIQGGGQLAAAGITSGSAQLTQMKNYLGGYLSATSRRQGAAAGAIGSILRDIDKLDMQGNAKRDAMYAQVKNKPILMDYPTMPAIPAYETPDNLKSQSFGFDDIGPTFLEGGIAGFMEVGGMDWIKGMFK